MAYTPQPNDKTGPPPPYQQPPPSQPAYYGQFKHRISR